MSIVFELGDGHGACLCVERFEKNLGPWLHCRYSKAFQVHVLVIGLLALKWRIRPYRYKARASQSDGEAKS